MPPVDEDHGSLKFGDIVVNSSTVAANWMHTQSTTCQTSRNLSRHSGKLAGSFPFVPSRFLFGEREADFRPLQKQIGATFSNRCTTQEPGACCFAASRSSSPYPTLGVPRGFQPWRPPPCGQNQRFRQSTNHCHDQTSVARICESLC